MIIETQKNNVELIGDIKEFKTGIDPKNLEFITTLLSSNLYSDPEQSFIREITSNAWDSHVEAGNTDTPVIIKFTKDSILIRDYGIGLSPERFETIFCNIGSSTKRESNDYIGGFGIGRFSALACSNVVYITSYYEGKAYHYIMTKNGNSITTNLVYVLDTEEKNGVGIELKNIKDMKPYIEALKCVVFFPNVYVDSKEYKETNFNEIKIKRFEKLSAASTYMEDKLLLGNVLYPCNNTMLNSEAVTFMSKIASLGIVINFKVGELNITPNRESIIYTSETKDIINKRILEAKQELYEIIKEQSIFDFTDIVEYTKSMEKYKYFDFFDSDDYITFNNRYCYSKFYYLLHEIAINSGNKITYKGKDLFEYSKSMIGVLNRIPYRIRGYVERNRISSKYHNIGRIEDKETIIIKPEQKLTSYIKNYLISNYTNYAIVNEISFESFKDAYKDYIEYHNDLEFEYVVKEFYEYIKSTKKFIDFDTDKDFLDYKNKCKESNIKPDVIKTHILYISKPDEYNYSYTKVFDTLNKAVDYIKNLKAGVIIDNLHSNNLNYRRLAWARKFYYITANKQIIEKLNKLKFSNRVSLEYLLKNDKNLSIAATLAYYFPSMKLVETFCIPSNFPEKIRKYYYEIKDMLKTYPSLYINYAYNERIEKDSYTEYICKEVLDYINKCTDVSSRFDLGDSLLETNLLNFLLMKNKVYRINFFCYNKMKTDKIIRAICKK